MWKLQNPNVVAAFSISLHIALSNLARSSQLRQRQGDCSRHAHSPLASAGRFLQPIASRNEVCGRCERVWVQLLDGAVDDGTCVGAGRSGSHDLEFDKQFRTRKNRVELRAEAPADPGDVGPVHDAKVHCQSSVDSTFRHRSSREYSPMLGPLERTRKRD